MLFMFETGGFKGAVVGGDDSETIRCAQSFQDGDAEGGPEGGIGAVTDFVDQHQTSSA